jgi:hypothetical protein
MPQELAEGETHSGGGAPHMVTGTPLFVAYSLLASGSNEHTVSSHLESLFYSLLYCATGKLLDEDIFKDYSRHRMRLWAAARRGVMEGPNPLRCVPERLEPFFHQLHQLFWPRQNDHQSYYRADVSVEQFVRVCAEHLASLPS